MKGVLTVDVPAVSDSYDQDRDLWFLDVANSPVIPHPVLPEAPHFRSL